MKYVIQVLEFLLERVEIVEKKKAETWLITTLKNKVFENILGKGQNAS